MENGTSYRARKRMRRRHLDRIEWLQEKAMTVAYWIAAVATTLLLGSYYPWWAVLLGLPVILVASLSFAAFAWLPLLIPIGIYEFIIDRIYAEERSGDRLHESKSSMDR